jgi:hypothetical protein
MSAGKVLGSMLAALVGLALTAVTATAQQRIGPNQQFAGVVNGSAANATVYVVCPGPASGQMGHPVAGQGVQVVENTGSGFTGSAADRIAANLTPTGTTSATLVFTQYGVPQDIPTTLFLPCSGNGTAVFTPLPTSETARNATVKLTFVNIAV